MKSLCELQISLQSIFINNHIVNQVAKNHESPRKTIQNIVLRHSLHAIAQ